MARGRSLFGVAAAVAVAACVLPEHTERRDLSPRTPALARLDSEPRCATLTQGEMVHVFDTTRLGGGPHYVNDHSLIQGPDGAWHLFGIFHDEPIGPDTEVDFIHAVALERDPARWTEGVFEVAPAPHTIALSADRSLGETHLWAPHVFSANDRYWMVYQGGGPNDYRASIRMAVSDDLYRWTRRETIPLFEDFCEARDPMVVRRDGQFAIYYTRCESISRKVSGVAYRTSRDLATWSAPAMALTIPDSPLTSNSGYTESPFVFERGGYHYLSVSAYPIAWDATLLYRSKDPLSFPDAPFTRLRGHAAEWVPAADGRMWVTHAGPGQRGVWIAPVRGL